MTKELNILLTGMMALFVSCGNTVPGLTPQEEDKPSAILYCNIFGDEIELKKVDEKTMSALFRNAETGKEFDTLLEINYNSALFTKDSLPYLEIKTGGVKMFNDYLRVYDFAGPATMQSYTGIQNIYDYPFYKINEPVNLKAEIGREKGGILMDGVYLSEGSDEIGEYVSFKGVLKKEKYPREYYSTGEHPQGMFGDTTIDHFRLVAYDYQTEVIRKDTFTGTAITVDYRRALVWEFADSEIYFLDEQLTRSTWPEEREGKEITISAILVRDEFGSSILKHWEILD